MEISKLIEIFNECIPTYQKAVDENWGYNKLVSKNMERGLCLFVLVNNFGDIYSIFDENVDGHYHNLLNDGGSYLFPTSRHLVVDYIEKCILPRLNFLKEQVIELKKLQKKGYTHV